MIKMIPLKSSSIKAAGHDPEKNELHIQMSRGDVFVFENVPALMHKRLLAAPSAGRFFNDHINGFHKSRKA